MSILNAKTIKTNTIIDSNGGNNVAVNGTTPTIYNTMGKNRVINGAMEINQRQFTISGANSTGYTVDRFMTYYNYSGLTFNVTQENDAPIGFVKSLKIAYASGAYSSGQSGYAMIRQYIELNNVLDIGYGTSYAKDLTFSFSLKSKRTGTFTLNILRNADGTQRQISRQSQITSADTWQKFEFTIPGDTIGAWNDISSPNAEGIYFDIIANTDVGWTGSALNTNWNTNNSNARATGQTNFIQSSGDYFSVTGVQVEVGSVATEFERRPYGTELALCQRYYFNAAEHAGGVVNWPSLLVSSGGTYVSHCRFPTTMRTAPTLVSSGMTGTNTCYLNWPGTGSSTLTSVSQRHVSTNTGSITGGQTNGFGGAGYYVHLEISSSFTGTYAWSAEL